jgi:Helix-turn-helix domain
MDAPSMPRARLERLGVGEVARLAGVTERSVRRAAATGRLAGRLGPTGAWWFHPDDVMRWQANRRGRSA